MDYLVDVGSMWMFEGTTAPSGFALCNGAVVPISQNQVLYATIGPGFGGNGVTTFALPTMTAPDGYIWIIATQGVYPNWQ